MVQEKGRVIWLTGLPCSGKTTIAKKLEEYFLKENLPVERLDGDIVRLTINNNLGFSKEDRDKNIEKVSYLAKKLSDDGINVIAAFVSPYRETRTFVRKIFAEGIFIEVAVKCSLHKCKKRDIKGMYAKAMRGEITNFTGVDDPYEPPENPEIVLDTEKETVEESANKVFAYLFPKL